MAMQIKTISVLFGQECVDRASLTLTDAVKVNGEWANTDQPAQAIECNESTIRFEFNGKSHGLTFDLGAVLQAAKHLVDNAPKWAKNTAVEEPFWYCYASEADRLEVECDQPGQWSLKVGLKTSHDPAIPGKRTAVVTGLVNFRRTKPMTVEF